MQFGGSSPEAIPLSLRFKLTLGWQFHRRLADPNRLVQPCLDVAELVPASSFNKADAYLKCPNSISRLQHKDEPFAAE
jgi:hypothetical protein